MKKLIVAAAVCCVLPLAGFAGSPMYGVGGGGVQKVTSGQSASITHVQLIFTIPLVQKVVQTKAGAKLVPANNYTTYLTLQAPASGRCTYTQSGCNPAAFDLTPWSANNSRIYDVNNLNINETRPVNIPIFTSGLWNSKNVVGFTASFYDKASNPVDSHMSRTVSNLTCTPSGLFSANATTLVVTVSSGGCLVAMK
ncbi:MAG: hypothetical protein NTZ67_06755 [Gammaproteobacteria bacterium]|nr:hypothetical protein [Gammaproteobacteria bacterium]